MRYQIVYGLAHVEVLHEVRWPQDAERFIRENYTRDEIEGLKIRVMEKPNLAERADAQVAEWIDNGFSQVQTKFLAFHAVHKLYGKQAVYLSDTPSHDLVIDFIDGSLIVFKDHWNPDARLPYYTQTQDSRA